MKKIIFTITSIACLFSLPAFAHHPMGGEIPTKLWHGLVSGMAHPIIGIDHFAFILAVGILTAFQKNRLLFPSTFIAGAFAGCLVFLSGIIIPGSEFIIATSVLLIGVVALSGKQITMKLSAILVALLGVFHGYAYGSGIIGAEASPLIAYLIAFSALQFCVILGTAHAMNKFYNIQIPTNISARLGGAVIAGIGFTFLIEGIEAAVFG